MRSIALAALTVLLAAGPVTAGPACTVLTDPAGDATVARTVPAPAETHVDVRTVTVEPARSGLTFRITTTDLTEHRLGEWRLTFAGRRASYFVGAGTGAWVNVGKYEGMFGFRAGVVGRRGTDVRGAFDYAANEIRVVVPYAVFGSAAPARGDTLTAFAVEAKESFANVTQSGVSQQVSVVDTGASPAKHVVGRAC